MVIKESDDPPAPAEATMWFRVIDGMHRVTALQKLLMEGFDRVNFANVSPPHLPLHIMAPYVYLPCRNRFALWSSSLESPDRSCSQSHRVSEGGA